MKQVENEVESAFFIHTDYSPRLNRPLRGVIAYLLDIMHKTI